MLDLLRKFLICAAFSLGLFAAAHPARACSCAVNETVEKDFQSTPNVVILKLKAVEKYADGEAGYGYDRVKQSKLTVEKVYKGSLKVGQELTFRQGGGADCIWTFSEEWIGQEFLFYLGSKPLSADSGDRAIASTTFGDPVRSAGVWEAFTCSRSGRVKYRTGDIKYLESVAEVRGKTRLSGTLVQFIDVATEDEKPEEKALAGYKINVQGNGKNIELKTDENGFYEIYDLPAGKYSVTPEKVKGYKLFWGKPQFSVEVEIKAGSHTEQNFFLAIDNRVRGTFFDANGKPLKGVCLALEPARGKERQGFFELDCTDEKGRFEIAEIPAGTYVLVINEDGKITASEPFGRFYYPNAVRREDAAELIIGAGDYHDNLTITAPVTAETITVSGVLLYEDGKPVADEWVEFYVESKKIEDGSEDSQAKTDENGRFQIRILKGQKGILRGSMYTFQGEFLNCPKLERLIKASGKSSPQMSTPILQIEALNDLNGIELKFPFPGCKKAIID